MQEIDSPLHFIDSVISEQALTCYSIKKEGTQNRLEVRSHNTHILTIASNKAILCEVDPVLCERDSGCPIVTENFEVIGMLVGGVGDAPCNNICGFQSATFIKHLISHV